MGSWESGKPQLPSGLQWRREGFSNLGFFSGWGDSCTEKLLKKVLVEKIKGRLDKWKYLAPKFGLKFGVFLLFNIQKTQLRFFWLLEEPLIYGARLDLTDNSFFPGLNRVLMGHDVITLSQLLNIVGADFKDEVALAQCLGIRSIRLVTQLLVNWKAALETTELELLTEYCKGSCVANPKDSFPCLSLSINVEGINSPFF